MKQIKARDNILYGKPNIIQDSLNLVSDMTASTKPFKLRTTIRATNSGYLLNNRVYPGTRMKDATNTWVHPYNKPIIKNHDEYSEPLGRIVKAEYHQLKTGNDFLKDFVNPDTGDDMGSGFITVQAIINDRDAIEKIIDGRYNTVSAGMGFDAAYCNLCGSNFADRHENADVCEHNPGRIYQVEGRDMQCYAIAGKISYKELSYLNSPAQPNAKTLSAVSDASYDAIRTDNENYEPLASYGSGSLLSLSLSDNDGHTIELLNVGSNNQLSNVAARIKPKHVFAFGSGEIDNIKDSIMKPKVTPKAESIIESVMNDAEAVLTAPAPVAAAEPTAEAKAAAEAAELAKAADLAKATEEAAKAAALKAAPVLDQALTVAFETATKEKDAAIEQSKKLQSTLDTVQALNDNLQKENVKLKADAIKDVARQLAMCRINLGKQGAVDITTKEKFDEYVNLLSKRSIESLRDSIIDILPEVSTMISAGGNRALYQDHKVDDPTKGRMDNTNKGKDEAKEPQSKEEFLDSIS